MVLKKNSDWRVSTMPDEGEAALHKRCGFKKPDGFRAHCTWAFPGEGKNIYVKVYGKTDGRAGSENKSELPPPVDTALFFGNLVVVASMGNDVETATPTPLSPARLNKLFDLLVGGTEGLGGAAADKADAAADEAEEETDEAALLPRTRQGYAKDGFVVEDGSDEDSDADTSSEPEESLSDDEDEGGSDAGGDSNEDEATGCAADAGMEDLEDAEDVDGMELQPEAYDSE